MNCVTVTKTKPSRYRRFSQRKKKTAEKSSEIEVERETRNASRYRIEAAALSVQFPRCLATPFIDSVETFSLSMTVIKNMESLNY